MKTVTLRFYEELNDFLPVKRKKRTFSVPFSDKQTVKDLIEAQGVPHAEIDLILVNGRSVSFDHMINDKDMISVYPEFELLDISDVTHLRPGALREPRFVLDVHLGKLSGFLRIMGFDTLYRNDYNDKDIAEIAAAEKRIVLTRDVGLLKRNAVERGYWVRSIEPVEQSREIVRKFDLTKLIRPFSRCMLCNGKISEVEKELILQCLLPETRKHFNRFFRCSNCKKIYWEGSHYKKLLASITAIQKL